LRTLGIRPLAVLIQVVIVAAIMAGCFWFMLFYVGHGMPKPRLAALVILWIPIAYLLALVWSTHGFKPQNRSGCAKR
jgi:uncharacterized membrane protein